MGREIRMVPPNWQHPKKTVWNFYNQQEERYQPMFKESYAEASSQWKADFDSFYASGKDKTEGCELWDWEGNPPDRDYYAPYSKEECTWYQGYETVSEGTPVTPPFASKEELANYLAVNGDFWDQDRRKRGQTGINCEPWGKEAAYKYVFGGGYMPSMIVTEGKILSRNETISKLNQPEVTDQNTLGEM